MPLTGLIFRLIQGHPLTSAQGDDNLRKIRDFCNALEQLFGVRLNADGTLKDGAVDRTEIIADGIITEDKLADDAKMPAGVMMPYAGTTIPAGWLLCDGRAVSREAPYDKLFAALGGTGSLWGLGSGTFNIPDMARRVPMGAGGIIVSNTPNGIGNAVGNYGGKENHLLTGPESGLKAHAHTAPWRDNTAESGDGNTTGTMTNGPTMNIATSTVAEQSATTAHNNIQPAAIVAYIIKF